MGRGRHFCLSATEKSLFFQKKLKKFIDFLLQSENIML